MNKQLYDYWLSHGYRITLVLAGIVVLASLGSAANAFFATMIAEHRYRHLQVVLAQDRLLAQDGRRVIMRLRTLRTQRRTLLRPYCTTTMHQLLANTILADPHLATNITNITQGPSADASPAPSPVPSPGAESSPFRVRIVSETATGGYYLLFRTLARTLEREPALSAEMHALAPGTITDQQHDDTLTATITIRQWRLPATYCRSIRV